MQNANSFGRSLNEPVLSSSDFINAINEGGSMFYARIHSTVISGDLLKAFD